MLTDDPRYQRTLDEYGERARRQLVSGLHLHVSLGGADRSLAVYNAFRSYLPEIAALAANAPFHGGRDTGLASIRPTIAVYLQRQGVPPVIPSWEWFASSLQWGEASDTVPDARRWWFELRLHATYGTLELRAPDAQSSVDDVCGVASYAYRPDAVARGALRRGRGRCRCTTRGGSTRTAGRRCATASRATLADLETGARVPTRELSRRAVPSLHPTTEALLRANGAIRTRSMGVDGAAEYLASRFLA